MATAFEQLKQKQAQKSSVGGPSATTAPATQSAFDKIKSKSVTIQAQPEAAPKEGVVGGLVKGLVSAPLTMVARPFQAVAQLAGASSEDVDKFSSKISGGLIAPVPQNFSDVKKDVGRGIETVALGVGSPMAAGAAFGFGSSLEQGNDIMSTDTLVSTLTGLGAGKLLGVAGKPIFDATGKVIGSVTPKFLKELAAKGGNAVQEFMAKHEIANGALKPITEKITAGAEKFDTAINKTTSNIWQGTKNTIKSQYPDTGTNIAKHYEQGEVDRFLAPTKQSGVTFNKAADVLKDAERRGIDLKQMMKDNKLYASNHITSDGKWDTKEVADALKNEAISGGADVFRPALAEAQNSVQRVPISEVRQRMIDAVNLSKDAKLSPQQKDKFVKEIMAEYGDNSVTAQQYRDGYNLTNLYDSKLNTSSNLYRTPKTGGVATISDSLTGQKKLIESKVFGDLLLERAPKELGLEAYMKAQEGKFVLADYLLTLDGKTAEKSLFQKGLKRTSQLFGATAGANVAGPFGMFSGFQFGGMVADTFAKAPNPVKIAFLKNIGKTEPEIYQIMKDYVSAKEIQRLMTPRLGPGNQSTIILPNKQGTPNISQGGQTIGGIRQKSSENFDRSVAEWKSSGSSKTYEQWLNKDKPIFESTVKKVNTNKVNPEVEQEIMELELRIGMLDDDIKNDPLSNLGDKTTKVTRKVVGKDGEITYKTTERRVNPLSALYDKKEGGFRELGDIRNNKTVRAYETAMKEAGITEPLEMIRRVNELNKQKASLAQMKAYLKNLKKNRTTTDTNPESAPNAPETNYEVRPEDLPF